MNYYHINKSDLSIVSGPHAVQSAYIKRLTNCGNPELLDLADYGLVPQVWPDLAEGERYDDGKPTIYVDRVEMNIEAIPVEELMQQAKATLTDAVQRHLDTTAQARGYDGILSLCSYAASPNPPFATEAAEGLAWRDAVWLYCFQVMADVQGGLRPIPTEDDLLAELPVIGW